MRIIVTRPAAQAAPWVQALCRLGLDAVSLPLIEIAPLADQGPLRQAWLALPQQALVMFVSANAVQHFFAARPVDGRWPAGLCTGSTGPGTSAALRAAGVSPADLAEPDASRGRFDSEALWQRLQARDWQGRRALIVRGEDGRDWLADTLRAQGARVDFVAAYARRAPQPDAVGRALLQAALQQPAAHLWHFSSSEAVGHLRALAAAADWSTSRALASHPRIVQAARDAGFGQVALVGPDAQAVADWLDAGSPLQSRGP